MKNIKSIVLFSLIYIIIFNNISSSENNYLKNNDKEINESNAEATAHALALRVLGKIEVEKTDYSEITARLLSLELKFPEVKDFFFIMVRIMKAYLLY